MLKHYNSLFISILIHVIILLIILFSYKYIFSGSKNNNKQIICVRLNSLVQTKEIINKKQIIKKKIQKQVKKHTTNKVIKPISKQKIQKQIKVTKHTANKVSKPIQNKQKLMTVSTEIIVKNQEQTHKNIKPVKSQQTQYLDENIDKILQLIQNNLYYPRRARKRGIEGKIIISFKILENGGVSSIELVSAKSDILARAAVKTIKDLSFKFPKPKNKLVLSIPISYRLK